MGKLAVIKTQETASSVNDFISGLKDEQKRKDSFVLLKLMQKVSGKKPKMWGSSIIGFGKVRYTSPTSGREVDWFTIGFSPRKTSLSLYLFIKKQARASSLKKLGKHKTGVGCLYINSLDDVNLKVLEEMMYAATKGEV